MLGACDGLKLEMSWSFMLLKGLCVCVCSSVNEWIDEMTLSLPPV